MKKMILFIAVVSGFALQGVFAQFSQLTVFHEDGERFWLIINGVKQNNQPQANVFVSDLKQDFVRVKVIFENEKINDIDRNIPLKDVDGNFTHSKYVIRPEKRKTAMRFHSHQVIVPPAKQAEVPAIRPVETPETKPVETPIVPKPTTTTTTTTTTHTTTVKPTETISVGAFVTDPVTGKPVGMDVSITVPATGQGDIGVQATTKTPDRQISTQTTTTQTTVTHQQHTTKPHSTEAPVISPAEKTNVYRMPGYSGKIGCPWPMSAQDFANAKRSISSKSFDDTRLTVAKQIASANCLLCEQVKEIMNLFSFEESKLEFAKFAFDYVYDISNYYKLNDAFTFSSSIEELDEYIRRKK